MYMPNAKILRWGPNATYIPLTGVGGEANYRFGVGCFRVFRYQHVMMLVSFALGDAKVWRWGSKPMPVPNANGFASQWNIGFKF